MNNLNLRLALLPVLMNNHTASDQMPNETIGKIKVFLSTKIEAVGQYMSSMLEDERNAGKEFLVQDYRIVYEKHEVACSFMFIKKSQEWRLKNYNCTTVLA